MIVRPGDLLISMTRPNRGAICCFSRTSIAIASTGFGILMQAVFDKEYLEFII